ncbi:MAG: hypothetical protein K1X83_11085 [Oligoflexia bacterium]|nr:hypothetical protein [Oligoflexia bacterium]
MRRKREVNFLDPSYLPKQVVVTRAATLYSLPFKAPGMKGRIERQIIDADSDYFPRGTLISLSRGKA